MSPRAGFYRAIPAEPNAPQVDPATWNPDLSVPIPHLQASSSSGAPTLPVTTPPQDGSPFPPATSFTPIPKRPLSDAAARMTLVARSTPSSSTLVRRASSSNPSPGAIVAIVAGVTVLFVIIAMLIHLQEMKAFFKSLITRIRRRGLATPVKEARQWDVLSWNEASALANTAASTPEPFANATHTAHMRDVNIDLVSTAEHAPLPPLRPNRRPPSGVVDPPSARPLEPAPPLPRLEPLRRKPSKATQRRPPALALPAREPTPPATPPKDPPPLASPAPSSTSTSEKRVGPSAPTKLVIQMPKPVRGGSLRPISAYTSASTTFSEMPLLKPSVRAHEDRDKDKDTRLSKVLTVANPNPNEAHSAGGVGMLIPPIPPVPPIPPIYLPKAASEKEVLRPLPAKLLEKLSSPPPGTKPMPTRTDSQSTATTTLSPTSPASLIGSSFSPPSPALRRQTSSSSMRGSPRSPLRKPVPPLVLPLPRYSRSPSLGSGSGSGSADAASSIWAPESGWRKNSLASTALDELAGSRWGSPVPSSSASQMYRTRDSGLSEWTWTRPLEDWEKEQLDLRRKASAGELSPPHTQRGVGGMGGVGGGGGGGGEVRWGHKASASMGEMRVVREIVPDVPKVPRQYRP